MEQLTIKSTFYYGDCLVEMDKIADKSVDMILCDLPYGTTACKWDSVIDFKLMWEQLNRIIKPNGAIVLFGSEPFSSALRMSNMKNFRYDWIWDKIKGSGFLNANKMPIKRHEVISIFYKKLPTYNKQLKKRNANSHSLGKVENYTANKEKYKNGVYAMQGIEFKKMNAINDYSFKNPDTIIEISVGNSRGQYKRLHPTQKPVLLMEYLILTYTNENETILDFTMGSGSTGVAAKNLNRNFIGIEMDENYFNIAVDRINNYNP